MSAWKILTKMLHAKGGGPLPRRAFDELPEDSLGLHEARARGLVGLIKGGWNKSPQWFLTPLGHDWCDGRVEFLARADGRHGRPAARLVATWLSALPRATP